MRKKNIIKLSLTRDKADTYLKIWVAPEIEQVFSNNQTGVDSLVDEAETQVSSRWFDGDGNGLRFYKNSAEFNSKLLNGDRAFNDFGKSLMDTNDYNSGSRVNIALLRIVGASQAGGVTIKTSELIGYEELKTYTELLAKWSKDFYRDYIKKAKLTATISLEI